MLKKYSVLFAALMIAVCSVFAFSVYADDTDSPLTDASQLDAVLSKVSYTYDGNEKNPVVTVTDAAGNKLDKNSDFTVDYDPGRTDVGTYYVRVNYIGDYTGTDTLSFVVIPQIPERCFPEISETEYLYDGSEKKPEVSITDVCDNLLQEGRDYTLTYDENSTQAGVYNVGINYIGNYSGSDELSYRIFDPANEVCTPVLSKTSYTYDGNEKNPTVKITDSQGVVLKKGTDYTLSYDSGRTEVGTYDVKITYMGNYGGTDTVSFVIIPQIPERCTATLSKTSYTYDGNQKNPTVTIKDVCKNVLVKGRDYTLTYDEGRTEVGTYNVRIDYIGNYSGSDTLSLKIIPQIPERCTAKLSKTSYTYDGNEKNPVVSIVDVCKNVLVKGRDYTVTYDPDRTNVGTYNVKVTYIGNYSGTKNLTFKVIKQIPSRCTPVLSKTSYTYDGYQKNPTMKITDVCNNVLVNGRDYTLTYASGRTNPGAYNVKITYKGNYSGTDSEMFIIRPGQVTGLKATSSTDNTVTLKWNKLSNVSGYQLLKYDPNSEKYVQIARPGANATSYTVSGLTASTAYHFKIRAFIQLSDGKTNYYGAYSNDAAIATAPVRISNVSVSKSGTSITVKWNTTKSSGYQIFYSTDKNFKTSYKCITINNAYTSSYTIRNVSSSAIYYVKVRAFINYNGMAHKGICSSVQSTNYSNLYATYSSNYVNNANRTKNLQLAAKTITGTIVQPGQTFSFNKVVGPRTAAKGYKPAPVFGASGVENGIGGGICQVSSTVFNCALNANVGIVERHQHSQRVTYVPLGRDAAIYGTVQDFKWKNTTNYPIKIVMTVRGGKITCSFYTNANVKPAKVSLKVTQSGNNFTLQRTVNGKVNYTCKSKY